MTAQFNRVTDSMAQEPSAAATANSSRTPDQTVFGPRDFGSTVRDYNL